MELLCIQTHSQGLVQAGSYYPMLGMMRLTCSCNCVVVNVGIPNDDVTEDTTHTECADCGDITPITEDDKWHWVAEDLFGLQSTQDELEQYAIPQTVKIDKI